MRRVLLIAVSAVVLGAMTPALASTAAPGAAGIPSISWLHVAHSGGLPVIEDSANRTVILHGVNVNGLQDGFYSPRTHTAAWMLPFYPVDPTAYAPGHCPADSHLDADTPLCEVDADKPAGQQSSAYNSRNDLAEMRALGFNVIRLTLSWSQLEPTPGAYSQRYLDRIAQVVGWARQQGVHVLLDMHEDNYSRFIDDTAPAQVPPLLTTVEGSGGHADGAPAWAIVDDGVPALAPDGVAELSAQVNAAFTSFWLNRPAPGPQGEAPGTGLQDHYIGAVAALARRFKDDPAVAGYEIMNEPLSGFTFQPGVFDQGYLYPFYRRLIDAVTGLHDGAPCPPSTPAVAACGYPDLGVHDTRHLFFFEPWAARNLVDFSPQVSAPFSSYPNLVYAPHTYTHVFTVDTLTGAPLPYPPSYDQALDTAAQEATAMHAALWVGEYGNSSNDDATLLASEAAAAERHLTGSAVWAWKGNCGPGQSVASCQGTWATYFGDTADPPAQNLQIKPSRLKYLARAVPWSTAGTLLRMLYDPDTATFSMSATSAHAVSPGDRDHETVVYVPAAASGVVRVSLAAVLDTIVTTPDGNRIAYVAPTGHGVYAVSVD